MDFLLLFLEDLRMFPVRVLRICLLLLKISPKINSKPNIRINSKLNLRVNLNPKPRIRLNPNPKILSNLSPRTSMNLKMKISFKNRIVVWIWVSITKISSRRKMLYRYLSSNLKGVMMKGMMMWNSSKKVVFGVGWRWCVETCCKINVHLNHLVIIEIIDTYIYKFTFLN